MITLPIWLRLLSLVVPAGAGLWYGRRLHARGITFDRRLKVREAPLMPLCLVLFVLFLVMSQIFGRQPRMAWILPVVVGYWSQPATWGLTIAFVTFPFVALATLAARLKRRGFTLGTLVLLTGILVGVDVLERLMNETYTEPLSHRERNGIILQTTSSTCATVSCANIARSFGVDTNEEQMARILKTTLSGTTNAQIIYGMRSLGFEARKKYSPTRNPNDITPPAVLIVDSRDQVDGHAVAYMGRLGDVYEILEPVQGRELLTLRELQGIWRGRAIEISRKPGKNS